MALLTHVFPLTHAIVVQVKDNRLARVRDSMPIILRGRDVVPFTCCMGQQEVCLMSKARTARARECPLHGPGISLGGHCITCRTVVQILYKEDAHVAVLPEFCVCTRSRQGKPGPGPLHRVDVLAVFHNGRCLAVEVDGRSHDSRESIDRDGRKEKFLTQHRVDLFRVCIRVPSQIETELHDLRLHVHSIVL